MSYSIKEIDGAIILHWTSTGFDEGLGEFEPDIIRPPAPFALNEVFVKRNIQSTVINYAVHWDTNELAALLMQWCKRKNISKPVLLVSSLSPTSMFDPNEKLQKLLKEIQEYTDFLFLMGGPYHGFTTYENSILPDYLFSGRTLHLLEHWLDGDISNIDEHCLEMKGIKRLRPKTSEVVENPIVPKLYDDYCLSETDVLSFEVRVGCKFNCTFCNFEHRNAKQVSDSTSEEIYEFLNDANKKYGIKYFNMCDDTANEDHEKLDILLGATRQLDFKPFLGGFSRFDLLLRNKGMVEKMDEIGYHAHWFGIESMHKGANKLIRKSIGREEITEYFKFLNKNYPHWELTASMIIGLPREPMDHTWSVFKENSKNKYIRNIFTYAMDLIDLDHNFASDLVKDPAKYGIEVEKKIVHDGKETQEFLWSHAESNWQSSRILQDRIEKLNKRSGIKKLDPWQILVSKSLGVDLNEPKYRDVDHPEYADDNIQKVIFPLMEKHIQNYISLKTDYLKNN